MPHRDWSRRRLVILLLVLPAASAAGQDLSQPGPYAVGWTRLTFARPDATPFEVQVTYPAQHGGGGGAPVARVGRPFCPIVFQSVVPPSQYDSTLTHLTSWGFVVAMPTRALADLSDHAVIAGDIGRSLDGLLAESSQPGTLLSGAVRGDRCGFSGHSLGGASAIIQAVAETDRVKVVAILASGDRTTPPASSVAGQLRVPLVMLAGTRDLISSLAAHVGPIYAAAPSPKALFVVSGGNHMQFADFPFDFLREGLLPQGEQLAISRHYLTATFRLYLQEHDHLWPLLWDAEHNGRRFVTPAMDSGLAWEVATPVPQGAAGEMIEFEARVLNRAGVPQGCDLFVETDKWPATIDPPTVSELPPDGSATVRVQVTLLANTPAMADTLRLSARSIRDGHTRGSITLPLTRRAPTVAIERRR